MLIVRADERISAKNLQKELGAMHTRGLNDDNYYEEPCNKSKTIIPQIPLVAEYFAQSSASLRPKQGN
jgi:hypothetical protein